ncbi:conserved Plasmodium protein, unknown function [Plasmodium gaboni]|uniref:Uncharacterized protein n=1 Tax=Plasmodium gaboni TaxID=647221 RepID=A0ABY1UJS3_9APIC|nr:conserved Plasmodium protein, unknown function [Plasmodium gaboni]
MPIYVSFFLLLVYNIVIKIYDCIQNCRVIKKNELLYVNNKILLCDNWFKRKTNKDKYKHNININKYVNCNAYKSCNKKNNNVIYFNKDNAVYVSLLNAPIVGVKINDDKYNADAIEHNVKENEEKNIYIKDDIKNVNKEHINKIYNNIYHIYNIYNTNSACNNFNFIKPQVIEEEPFSFFTHLNNYSLLKGKKNNFFYKDRNKLNDWLCTQYLPQNISCRYIKNILSTFRSYDSNIKENILYHLLLKYIYYNKNDNTSFEKKIELLNIIDQNKYKFILDHVRVLHKVVKKEKDKIIKHIYNEKNKDININDKINDETNILSIYNTEKNNINNKKILYDNINYNNKIIDIYLKMRKKYNILFVTLKRENKQNVYKIYKKIKRNITFYDFYDRLLILNYFHISHEHRLVLLFFKKYIYKLLNKENMFIINFINSFFQNNILSKYILYPKSTYNESIYTDIKTNKNISEYIIKDKYKLYYLPINTSNFIEYYMKNFFFPSYLLSNINNNNNNINVHTYDTKFLFYLNMLHSFLEMNNYYFIHKFIEQFCTYYSKNISNHIIYDDNKWSFFILTLSFLMRYVYMKRKFHIFNLKEHQHSVDIHYQNESDEYKMNAIKNINNNNNIKKINEKKYIIHNKNDNYLSYPIHIYNEDIFNYQQNYCITNYYNHLNHHIIDYIKNVITRGGDIHNKRKSIYKNISLLLFLQYVFLLNLDIDNIHFLNKKSKNYFENIYVVGTTHQQNGQYNNNEHCDKRVHWNLEGIKKKQNNNNHNSDNNNNNNNVIENNNNVIENNNNLIENNNCVNKKCTTYNRPSIFYRHDKYMNKDTYLHSNNFFLFPFLIKGYKNILKSCFLKTNSISDNMMIYNYSFEQLYYFIKTYLDDNINKYYFLYNNKNKENELILNIKPILSLFKINILFFFKLIYILDICNYKYIALSIINKCKKKKWFKIINNKVIKLLINKFKCKNNKNCKNKLYLFSLSFIENNATSEYMDIYNKYKMIINSNDKKFIKKIFNSLIQNDNKIKNNNNININNNDIYYNNYYDGTKNKCFKIFKKYTLPLNIKQIFFLFNHLQKFNLNYEIIILYNRLFKYNKYIKNNIYLDKDTQIFRRQKKYVKSLSHMYRRIFSIYIHSILSVNNLLLLNDQEKIIKKNKIKIKMKMKNIICPSTYSILYKTPLYIFRHFIKKYKNKQLDMSPEGCDNRDCDHSSDDKNVNPLYNNKSVEDIKHMNIIKKEVNMKNVNIIKKEDNINSENNLKNDDNINSENNLKNYDTINSENNLKNYDTINSLNHRYINIKKSIEDIIRGNDLFSSFDEETMQKFKKSNLVNKFFNNSFNPTYKLLSKKDYTLIFYIIMKYIYKHKIKYTYDILCIDKENNLNVKGDGKKKKNNNKINKYYNNILYIYLYFLLTLKCYMNIYKIDQITFLIILKIIIIMDDMTSFKNFLLINENKKLIDDNILYINSLINNYYVDNYKNNIKGLNEKDNNMIFSMKQGICIDMYIMKDNNLMIYNLNYYKLIKKFCNIFKYNNILKIYFYFDCRKISHTLLNLSSIFSHFKFLNNPHFIKYIYDKEGILLSPKNIYDSSQFVIFYGNCMFKKSKIFEFLTSSFFKNVTIHKNDLIKDAYVFSIRGE